MAYRYGYVGLLGALLASACGNTKPQEPATAESGAGGAGASAGAAPSGGRDAEDTAGGAPEMGGRATLPPIGSGGSDVRKGGITDTGGPIPPDDGPQALVDKVDLLIAVDNSRSMAEKQKLFAKTVPELLKRLVSPYCVNDTGSVVARPASPDEACPSGEREFAPLRDLHVGVITSSLGSHGAGGNKGDVCTLPTDDDHGYLVGSLRSGVTSYDGRGFLKWDPDGLASPPGESDVQALVDSLETMVVGAGETGCGYEAQLESIYRFLVDPEPPLSVQIDPATRLAKKVGVDQNVLTQRAAFLRPDSSVAVLVLTDENDCSVQDGGYGYLTSTGTPMYRSSSACLTDPNDPCCQSCGETIARDGCPALTLDEECKLGAKLAMETDDLNLRCWEQKRRFGFDLLYPTARYVSGFGGGDVPNAAGDLVENPLFHRDGHVRDPSLFTFSVLAGVPWQDVATVSSLTGAELDYLTPSELTKADRWSVILGDFDAYEPPSDPFMRESMLERSGKNPIVDVSIVPASSSDPQANVINGHEQLAQGRDLQYSCTFELPEPIDCNSTRRDTGASCDCFDDTASYNRPLCQPPGGGVPASTQYYGKAYPALRPLAVAKELGRRTVLGSICARNTHDDTKSDYGYRPLFGALGRRISATLVK